jgi:hypothetical protein
MKPTRRVLTVILSAGLVLAASAAERSKPLWQSPVVSKGMVDIDVKLDGPKRLWLVIGDGGDGTGCDWANWIEPRIETPGGVVKLADLKWATASTGWGNVTANKNANGQPLLTDGKTFEEGLGAHSPSVICFDLPAGATRFTAKGALDGHLHGLYSGTSSSSREPGGRRRK